VVQNSYDLNGNRTNIVYPGGLSVSYTYDAENRLESVTTEYAENTESFSFGYDSASRMTNIVYPNGVNSTFGCDAESRVTNYTHGSFISRSIVRDPRGYKSTENIISGLEPEMIEGEQRFTNDAADRITHIDQRDTWLGGELNQWYERSFSYDDNGCLTQENVTRPVWNTNSAIDEYRSDYSWDDDNRLTGAEKTVLIGSSTNGVRTWTDGPSVSTEYIYDASGVRIGRVHNSVTNWFVVDYTDPLKRPLCETDSSGTVTRCYVWAGFRLLAHIEADGTVLCYHQDELGSTLAITDEAGTVTDQFAYTPYGKCTARTGSTTTPYQWLGGYGVCYDTDAGLHLTLHRAYSAEQKRFISTDPSGIDGGANLYAYGNLNPLAFVDPSGEIAETIWDIANIGMGAYSLQNNVRNGSYGWAALDAVGLVYDTIATAIPFLPAGVSAGLKALRAGNAVADSVAIGTDISRVSKSTHNAARSVESALSAPTAGTRIHQQVAAEVGGSLSRLDSTFMGGGANKISGPRPDLIGNNLWGDITTKGQWSAHVSKYAGNFGNGIPVLYERGLGVSGKLYSGAGLSLFGGQYITDSLSGGSFGSSTRSGGIAK
jgi:RHS repeat-associated protein